MLKRIDTEAVRVAYKATGYTPGLCYQDRKAKVACILGVVALVYDPDVMSSDIRYTLLAVGFERPYIEGLEDGWHNWPKVNVYGDHHPLAASYFAGYADGLAAGKALL